MIAVHRITEDLCEDSYGLIALHSSLEDYALVYALNFHLKSNLRRTSRDLETMECISFPVFEWKDKVNDGYWNLINNSSLKEESMTRDNLFEDETSVVAYHFLPEFKEVDYFLKIEQENIDLETDVIRILNTIPQIMAAYTIETDKLKSKKNLIF
ncbi:IPExxxVDY family protein [Ulvibacterium sp.]|uniref:IPExxxVDY family protein n=1 Tax=Ulvibacterium sp. TaxID=2665914 RepID=UPI00262B051F|nr:IPExxxVDY family protein [Ulvibacterium sp.]